MLKGISPIISPELLKLIAEMGHGDELVLADANFPGASIGKRCIDVYKRQACGCLPFVSALSSGTRTIILTVLLSAGAALLFPISDEGKEDAA